MTGVSNQYPSHQLSRSIAAFSELLQLSSRDDKLWQKTVSGINRHGLLSLTLEIKHESRVPEIDKSRLEHDRQYRRKIARSLSKPLAPTSQTVVIPLVRARLTEPAYLLEISGILAHRWNQKIFLERADVVTQLTLLQINAQVLAECLEKLYLHEMTANNVSKRALQQFAYEAMDEDPSIQKTFAKLNEECNAIEERFEAEVDRKLALIKEDTSRRLAEIVARCKSMGTT